MAVVVLVVATAAVFRGARAWREARRLQQARWWVGQHSLPGERIAVTLECLGETSHEFAVLSTADPEFGAHLYEALSQAELRVDELNEGRRALSKGNRGR